MKNNKLFKAAATLMGLTLITTCFVGGTFAKYTTTGGGSDTNVLNGNGIKAINLGIGMKKAHTLEEYIAIEDIINSSRAVVEIIREA